MQVSDFLKTKMPLELAEQLGEGSSRAGSNNNSSTNDGSGSSSNGSSRAGAAPDVAAALSATFLHTNEALRSGSGVNITYSGSTAVLCMLQGRRLTTAWVGDSRAVLARQVGNLRCIAVRVACCLWSVCAAAALAPLKPPCLLLPTCSCVARLCRHTDWTEAQNKQASCPQA
jgi:hypothetical protein